MKGADQIDKSARAVVVRVFHYRVDHPRVFDPGLSRSEHADQMWMSRAAGGPHADLVQGGHRRLDDPCRYR